MPAPTCSSPRVPSRAASTCGSRRARWGRGSRSCARASRSRGTSPARTRSPAGHEGGNVHLTPRELDKLMLHQAGFVAQKRLARGLRLNAPETVALIATVLLELIRDGKRVAELMDLGRRLLGRRQVMDGVPELVPEVQVEGTFADGSKLVTVHHPIASDDGELALALHGSFL